jgi:hypothetical protein
MALNEFDSDMFMELFSQDTCKLQQALVLKGPVKDPKGRKNQKQLSFINFEEFCAIDFGLLPG